LIQTDLETIEAKFVIDRPMTDAEQEQMTQLIQQSLHFPFNIKYSFPETIPRSSGGKFEDFVSLVN